MALVKDFVKVIVNLEALGQSQFIPTIPDIDVTAAIWQPGSATTHAAFLAGTFVLAGATASLSFTDNSLTTYSGSADASIEKNTAMGGRMAFEFQIVTSDAVSTDQNIFIEYKLDSNNRVGFMFFPSMGMARAYQYVAGALTLLGTPIPYTVGDKTLIVFDSTQPTGIGIGIVIGNTIFTRPTGLVVSTDATLVQNLGFETLSGTHESQVFLNNGNIPWEYVVPSGFYPIGLVLAPAGDAPVGDFVGKSFNSFTSSTLQFLSPDDATGSVVTLDASGTTVDGHAGLYRKRKTTVGGDQIVEFWSATAPANAPVYAFMTFDASGTSWSAWRTLDGATGRTFAGVSDAVAFVTANPDKYEGVSTRSYKNEDECLALSVEYPDGGSADYIVGVGFGTADGGSVFDAGSKQLKLDNPGDLVVEKFGAVGGTVEDGVAVQRAATYLTSIGGGQLVFTSGKSYKISDNIDFGANITVLAEGAFFNCVDLNAPAVAFGDGALWRFKVNPNAPVTISADIVAGDQDMTVSSTTSMSVGDFVRLSSDQIQYHNGSAIAENVDINKIAKIVGNVVTLSYPVLLDYDNATFPVDFEVTPSIRNCYVIGGTYGGGGVVVPGTDNNKGQSVAFFQGVISCGLSRATASSFFANVGMSDRCIDFVCHGLQMTGREIGVVPVEGVDSSFYGVVAVRTRDAVMRDCNGIRMRHVGDASQAINVLQDSCTGVDGHRASFGSHEATYNLRVQNCSVDNTLDTASGVAFRAASGLVSGCDIRAATGISTAVMDAGERVGSFRITNNNLVCFSVNAGLSISGAYSSLLVQGNTVDCEQARTIFLAGKGIFNTLIHDNLLSGTSGIEVGGPGEGLVELNGLSLSNNTITDYTTNGIILRGTASPSSPADGIIITGNMCLPPSESSNAAIILRGDGFYGDFVKVRCNSHFGDSSLVVQVQNQSTFTSHPVIEFNDSTSVFDFTNRIVADSGSSSLGDNATLLRGAIINRKSPSIGQPSSWTVIGAGTEGSFAGVTGSIDAGTNTLTLTGNDDSKAFGGSFISISGAGAGGSGLTTRIVEISDDFVTATVETTAGTTVVAATVSRRNPSIGITSVIS